ncbi:MAG: TolC family protein [Bacteroidales bacterium]|nr:TolC family protein [Bacteroidales bacterium]
MKLKIIILLVISFLISNWLQAQQSWTLDDCINYALEHNYTVKKQMIEIESNRVQLSSSKNNRLPGISAYANQNFEFGRSETASNLIVESTQANTSMGVGLELPIFNGFQVNHQIKSNDLNLQASLKDFEQAKEDLTLNVTAYFLDVLLGKALLRVAQEQVLLSEKQVEQIQQLVANGRSSDAELYEARATLANDQLTVVKAENDYNISKLNLSQLMNVTDPEGFDIIEPPIDQVEFLMQQNLDLQGTIDRCLNNRPGIQAADLRIEKSKRDIKVQQAGWYPSLSLNANWGTGYYYAFKDAYSIENKSFGDQFKNNSREVVGLSLNIPIFDKLKTRDNVKLSKLSLQNQEIALEETKTNMIKEIHQAYNNAVAAKNQYLSAEIAVSASQKSLEYENLKFESGRSTNYEYNEAKTKYFKAQSDEIQAKFQYILRYKIMEFYGR